MSDEEQSFGSLMAYDPDSEALTLLMFRINSLIKERDDLVELTHLLGRALKATRWDSPVLCDEAMKRYENYFKG